MAIAPIIAALAAGIVFGKLRNGRLAAVPHTRVHARLLFLIAVGAGVAVDLADVPRPGLWAAIGLGAGLIFALRNAHLVGTLVVSVGIMANLVPVVLNGATPVRADALVEAGMVAAEDLDRVSLSGARQIADDNTILTELGDTIPLPIADQVISFGDLIMLVGVASLIAGLMVQRRPRRVPASALASLEAFGWCERYDKTGSTIELTTDLRPLDPEPEDRQLVAAASSTTASAAHD